MHTAFIGYGINLGKMEYCIAGIFGGGGGLNFVVFMVE